MGNKPSIGAALERRFADLRKEYQAAKNEETLDVYTARDLRRKLAQLSLDLQDAIDDRKVKATDHSVEDLTDSIKNLDQTLNLLEEHFNIEAVEKRRLRRQEAIALREREELELDYARMMKNLDRERDRRFNLVHHAEMDLVRASEHTREGIQKKLTQGQQDFEEIEKQIAYFKTSEGTEHWISQRKVLVEKRRQEHHRREEERRRSAPDVPVRLLDFGPVKDPLSQLKNALLVLLEAGNSAGGYTEPDLEDVAMTKHVSEVTVQVNNLLDHSQLNQASHTRRIYDSVYRVVETAYKAGYNIDDPTVRQALKKLVIAYASSAYESDSGERDQDAKLLPRLYDDVDAFTKK